MAEQTTEETRHREMIEEACRGWGFTIDDWGKDEDDRVEATLGRWHTIEDDEEAGLFADDDGVLTASVVGGLEYNNERVSFAFTPDGMDSGMEVRSPDMLEPAD